MIRLDVGLSPSGWGVWLGCMVPTFAVLSLLMLVPGWLFLTSSEIPAVGLVLVLPALLLDVFLVAALAHHYRNAFWLDGRVLVRRTLTGRTRYDLTLAHVGAESAQPQWAGTATQVLPRLIVQLPGRPPLRMWLRDPARKSALLPPHQLAALAQAIDPTLHHPVAHRLWTLSSDPFGGTL